jgi:acyl-CoA thioesterase-1
VRTVRHGTAVVSILALAALLGGCGLPFGTGAGGPHAYAPDDGRPTIVCLGDSLTAGDGAPSSRSYPAWLQKRLDAAGYRYRVVNAGVGGDRVADGLRRLDADVFAYHPVIVIVELGSNDPGHDPPEQWGAELAALVGRIRRHGAQVVLGGLDEPGMTAVYRSVATAAHLPLVYFTAGLWSRPGLWANAHHPDGAGYRVVMENFWVALQPMLTR